ncbi:MAG: hypothetical protein E3J54_06275, partial [Actinobacteria bacterium]
YLLTIVILFIIGRRNKWREMRLKIPLLGVTTSLMLFGMSLPLGFIPFHVNLATFAGILLGPGLGFIASFISVFFLSLIGHGGITMVGINSLTVGIEAVAAGFLSVRLARYFRKHFRFSVALTTVISLVLSIGFIVAVIVLSTVYNVGEAFQLQTGLELTSVGLRNFLIIIFVIALVGISIETLITIWVINFIKSVRPDILER